MEEKKDIYSILRRKFPESEYALMEEVSDAAGFYRSRSADYILMNLWPSRGLSLSGIEQKVSRSDWLSELKKPHKAENIYQYCDYFWLLTGNEDVAKLEEIPETWGWMCIKGAKIFIKKDAPKLTPIPITKHFLAAMLKRASSKQGFTRTSEIEDKINAAREDGKEREEKNAIHLRKRYDELKDNVEKYKNSTGIDLSADRWGDKIENIGAAVNFISKGGADAMEKRLIELQSAAEKCLSGIKAGIETISQLEKKPVD